jgi:hypothetical protein
VEIEQLAGCIAQQVVVAARWFPPGRQQHASGVIGYLPQEREALRRARSGFLQGA